MRFTELKKKNNLQIEIFSPDMTEKIYSLWSEVKSLSYVWLFVTPWTVAYQAPLSMEFSRQGYWNGLPFPSPGIFPILSNYHH